MAPVTLHVQGTGGARFDMDVPEGGHARERFLQRIELGDLVALDDDGYPIDRIALLEELDPDAAHVSVPSEDLAAMTVKELRALAAERGVTIDASMKKADLVELLTVDDEDDD